ncbi:peptide chain release factor 2 [Alkalibaculum sporogenes]|uniref:peptide chain release factor 2 n=1 Tax=Alkalibaculum sporogenes TaxID=2655001 RepID=UPI0031B5ECD5
MIELQEYKKHYKDLTGVLIELGIHFDLSRLHNQIDELDQKINDPEFWNDQDLAQKILKHSNLMKNKQSRYSAIQEKLADVEVLFELLEEEDDEALIQDLQIALDEIQKEIDDFYLETLLSGEYDANNAIVSLHPGAGGTESQDWAEMLLRLYMRWADNRGFKVKTLDYQPGDEAGIKSVTFSVEGINVYGYLKCEKGVHRLVRISPFDSSGRRHTSFASVDVTPELEADSSIELNTEDLRIDTFRSSGAGGQHVNTTDSAIRITHIPTGLVVQCQNERSQHKNKETAMKMLISKLVEIKEMEHKDKVEDIQGKYGQIAWGNQIRSYVFHPYSMVKDHRTNTETGNVQGVMDGSIDIFINDYLKKIALDTKEEGSRH